MQSKKDTLLEVMCGTVCLILSLGLLFLSIYIIPYLLWHLPYSVPTFILEGISYFEDNQNYTRTGSSFVVWLLLLIPGIITGIISYFITRDLDKRLKIAPDEVIKEEMVTKVNTKKLKESAHVGLKIFGLMMICLKN